ncbi:hypothetical protein [Streptomyces sp. VRA16 Mangrove soil]|uniref:hypothetical protein n=1 Tax=Streptomyces sp. VRA16 Mangrove soil TaxID=2817434 RepID=UPI001A9F6A8F|nr:hypothetical protein [Streptomyces sp. VRA16 Mangrove soil]MBO1330349.1 hypothetical protein [Streptomyces sp. VRA16 Mangrove soil]
MEQREIILRAIGVLTETQEMVRRLSDGEALDTDLTQLGRLVSEVFPTVEIPAGASAEQAAELTIAALMPASVSLVEAFAFLFTQLAKVHDEGHSDVNSAELLQEIAVRMSDPGEPGSD